MVDTAEPGGCRLFGGGVNCRLSINAACLLVARKADATSLGQDPGCRLCRSGCEAVDDHKIQRCRHSWGIALGAS
jgi:hypothetical protein